MHCIEHLKRVQIPFCLIERIETRVFVHSCVCSQIDGMRASFCTSSCSEQDRNSCCSSLLCVSTLLSWMCLRCERSSRILLEYRGSQCCENLILDSEMIDSQYKYLTNSSLQETSNSLMSQGKEWNVGSRLSLLPLSLITADPTSRQCMVSGCNNLSHFHLFLYPGQILW